VTTDVVDNANDSTLRVINFAQDTFLKAYSAITSRVPSVLTPSWMLPDPERSREAIERAFDFQAQLLESRKAFALGLLEAGTRASEDDEPKKATAAAKK